MREYEPPANANAVATGDATNNAAAVQASPVGASPVVNAVGGQVVSPGVGVVGTPPTVVPMTLPPGAAQPPSPSQQYVTEVPAATS